MASKRDSSSWQLSSQTQAIAPGPRSVARTRRREKGVFAIMLAPLLIVIVIFCGLAIDAGQLYNRKVDLTGVAKAVALAAARELNGSDAGIAAARTRARETAEAMKFQHFGVGTSFVWNDAALSFECKRRRAGNESDALLRKS
jgi:hypothetical protein